MISHEVQTSRVVCVWLEAYARSTMRGVPPRRMDTVRAIPPIPTRFCSVVCLSVVCHIHAACLNHSMDLDAVYRYTRRVQKHIVLDEGPWEIFRG